MRLFVTTLILFSLPTLFAGAQSTTIIQGVVINEQTKKPIPYANIGILLTEIGTLSNEDGSFSFILPKRYENRNLLVSSIGYEKKSIPITELTRGSNQISLTELVPELDEVVVSTEKFKKRKEVLGNGKADYGYRPFSQVVL